MGPAHAGLVNRHVAEAWPAPFCPLGDVLMVVSRKNWPTGSLLALIACDENLLSATLHWPAHVALPLALLPLALPELVTCSSSTWYAQVLLVR